MQIKELLSPINGLFSNMPDDIWGPDFNPSLIDTELFIRIGALEASPLLDHYTVGGVLNTEEVSRLLFQKYGSNWKRLWDTLLVTYNVMLTSSLDETRSTLTESENTETRALTDAQTGTVTDDKTTNGSNVRSGSVTRSGETETTRDLTDLETRALTASEDESGTEKLTDTFNERTDDKSTITFSGVERTVTGVDEARDLEKRNTGTVEDSGSEAHTGTGSHSIDHGVYGVGGAGLVNESRDVDSETRDFTDSKKNTRTDNTVEKDGGTVSVDTEETKSFTGRNDATVASGSHTGTVEHETDFGKKVARTDNGTVNTKHTGTEGTDESSTETFNELTDAQTGTERGTETRNLTDQHTGTIGNAGNEVVTDTFHSEGSSPLRTYQALILEEIEIRTGERANFTDLVIRDVKSMIASRIWRRHRVIY